MCNLLNGQSINCHIPFILTDSSALLVFRVPAHGKFYVQTICLSVSVARAPRHAVRKGQSTFLTVCSGLLAICLRFVSNRTNFDGKNIRNLLENDKDKNGPNKQFVVNLPFAFTLMLVSFAFCST